MGSLCSFSRPLGAPGTVLRRLIEFVSEVVPVPAEDNRTALVTTGARGGGPGMTEVAEHSSAC